MTFSRSTLTLCLTVALPVLLPLTVHAQNDPVTGSMMLQTGAQQQAAAEAARQRAQQAAPPTASTPANATATPARSVVRQLPNPAVTTVTAPAAPTAPTPPTPPQAVVVAARVTQRVAAPAPAVQPNPQPIPQPTLTGKQNNGDVSRSVLQMQAEGRYAAPPVPTLGATARLSWERYVQSFRTPIPEFYPTNSQPK